MNLLLGYFESHWPVHQKQIQIVKAEFLQTTVQMLCNSLRRVESIPAFACNEQVFSLQSAVRLRDTVSKDLTNMMLVLIDIGAIKVSVACSKSGFDSVS